MGEKMGKNLPKLSTPSTPTRGGEGGKGGVKHTRQSLGQKKASRSRRLQAGIRLHGGQGGAGGGRAILGLVRPQSSRGQEHKREKPLS